MRYFIYCRKSTEAEDRQVASIESQLTTLQRAFGNNPEIQIVGIYEESYSAKAPGRELFGAMLERIERGDADGIIAWAPDRLARNSIDGGRIIYMLDCGIIRDLKFATYTFESNSQGKFMLQIMFGQSKYYSDALSDTVKRGNRTKLEKGWRPNQAPLGYRNDPVTKTIAKDDTHFPLIQKMFEMMLSGAYTPRQIATIARDEWGFRTPKRKRIGGVPLAMSSVYKILSNPFYAGIITWGGQTYPGKHEAMISVDEFQTVRRLLERPGRIRPQRHSFAFTGMIRCGSCGLSITAEHKFNRYGRHYVYYHCTKRALGPRCHEPSVSERSLETQIRGFLTSLTVDEEIAEWLREEAGIEAQHTIQENRARKHSLDAALQDVGLQLAELTRIRLRGLLTDNEFVAQRSELQMEELRLRDKLAEPSGDDPFEPFRDVLTFRNQAVDWFQRGDNASKRLIVETVGSNLFLRDKIVSIQAKKPFVSISKSAASCKLLRDLDSNQNKLLQRQLSYH